jgi:outer membrane receptor protein involved in Fe transport
VDSVEYSVPCERPGQTDCLPLEAAPLDPENDDLLWFGGLRLDKSLGATGLLTLEGGTTSIRGPVVGTSLSRTQFLEQDTPWARVNYSSRTWNLLGYYNEARGPARSLASGRTTTGASLRQLQFEGQGNWGLARDRLRIVAGGMFGQTRLPNRFLRPAEEERWAAFGQADWRVGERLRLVGSGRVDDSTLFDARFSPRAAVVYSPTPLHTLRLSFARAWEQPTIAEFLLFNDAGPPQDLSALQAELCDPVPVDCGFGTPDDPNLIRAVAVGNESLRLQETTALELGYRGVLGRKVLLTLDAYLSRNEDFISTLLPQLGTPLGRINQNFGPWQPPPGVPDPVRDAIREQVPLLSNGPDDASIIVARSYTNFGDVQTRGAEVGVRYFPSAAWALSLAYAWADYEIEDQVTGTEDLLRPNAPEHAVALGASYTAARWNARLSWRWVDDFRWAAGVFEGDVPSYASVDLQANYRFAGRWRLSLNVANLLDDVHYEKFGGDLLSRRALVSLAYAW